MPIRGGIAAARPAVRALRAGRAPQHCPAAAAGPGRAPAPRRRQRAPRTRVPRGRSGPGTGREWDGSGAGTELERGLERGGSGVEVGPGMGPGTGQECGWRGAWSGAEVEWGEGHDRGSGRSRGAKCGHLAQVRRRVNAPRARNDYFKE